MPLQGVCTLQTRPAPPWNFPTGRGVHFAIAEVEVSAVKAISDDESRPDDLQPHIDETHYSGRSALRSAAARTTAASARYTPIQYLLPGADARISFLVRMGMLVRSSSITASLSIHRK